MLNSIDISKRAHDIPSLPSVVTDIIETLNDDDSNIESLTEKIMMDPALSARVLMIANSPFYGLSGKISSLKEACIVLGAYSIKNLAVAAGIVNNLKKSGNILNFTKLWEHSVGTGVAAKIIAEKLGFDHEIAFTAGLLHDVGKIVLDTNYPSEYKKVVEFRAKEDCFILEAEKATLGVTHSEIGEITARHWKLPDLIVDVIKNHHTPYDCNYPDMVGIVHLADILCRALEIGYPGDNLIPSIHPCVFERQLVRLNDLNEQLETIDSLSRTSIKLIISS